MSRWRAVLLAWLAVAGWSAGLHLRAALDPPAGFEFAGNFHWLDDYYNYLSYAQQAQDGAFLFHNKLAPPPSPALLVNLEWWLTGTLARLLGGRLQLAFALVGAAATLLLVAGAERWLARLGVGPSHRLPSLLLVAFGGGLGGLLFEVTERPVHACPDLWLALYPFLEIVGNPHFVCGTALLLWSSWLLTDGRRRHAAAGVFAGSVLALVRPYDVALLVLMQLAHVLRVEPRGRRLRALLPLLGLVPPLGYDWWVFFRRTEFASFQTGGRAPDAAALALAFFPALALALAAELAGREPGPPAVRRARVPLWAWAGACLVLGIAQPRHVALQLMVGAATPLLILLAAAAARHASPRALVLLALAFSTSAVVETRILLREDTWFVPRERLRAARALAPLCRPGERLLAPPDVSLFAIGSSACSAVVAHPSGPGFDAQLARVRSFYGPASPEERQRWLDAERVDYLVLPGWAGPVPAAWLGAGTPFRSVGAIGAPPLLSLYARRSSGARGAEGL